MAHWGSGSGGDRVEASRSLALVRAGRGKKRRRGLGFLGCAQISKGSNDLKITIY